MSACETNPFRPTPLRSRLCKCGDLRGDRRLANRFCYKPAREPVSPCRPLESANRGFSSSNRGGALLAVLWLSAILSAIAFSLATTVRGETERTATQSESVRAYYLATGAIERALLYMELGPPRYQPGMPRLTFNWPTGVTEVEILPEFSKFDINTIAPADLARLLQVLGAPAERIQQIVPAIIDWRTAIPVNAMSPFDQLYQNANPSFRGRHASLEETEELLLVNGMTPDLFYGSYGRDLEGRLQPRAGLKDCVSVYGSTGPFDINTAHPAVLAAIGFPPDAAVAIVQRRYAQPFRREDIAALGPMVGPAASRVTIADGSATIITLRATARLRTPNGPLSDLTRSVAATFKFHKPGMNPQVEVLRWYEN